MNDLNPKEIFAVGGGFNLFLWALIGIDLVLAYHVFFELAEYWPESKPIIDKLDKLESELMTTKKLFSSKNPICFKKCEKQCHE